MARPCIVDQGCSLADAVASMAKLQVDHLVVVADGRLAGVVDVRDLGLAFAVAGGRADTLPVALAMRDRVYTCAPNAPLSQVLGAMQTNRHDCAVVVEGGQILGVFSVSDALTTLRSMLARRYPHTLSRAPRVSVLDTVRSHGAAPDPNIGQIRLGRFS